MDDTLTLTESEWAQAVADMASAGHRDGTASGSWIADGNTSEESLRAVLEQWDNGDPAAPCAPSPFSGEWADDPTVDDIIGNNCDIDIDSLTPEERDELADSYESAYSEAWQTEAERTARHCAGGQDSTQGVRR